MPAENVPDIESLRARHKALDRQKTTEEANLKNAQTQLDALKAKAREEYGTDDLAALRKKLQEMEAENLRQRTEYHAHLNEIQRRLDEVKSQFSEAQR